MNGRRLRVGRMQLTVGESFTGFGAMPRNHHGTGKDVIPFGPRSSINSSFCPSSGGGQYSLHHRRIKNIHLAAV
jgi:hypothetical protein